MSVRLVERTTMVSELEAGFILWPSKFFPVWLLQIRVMAYIEFGLLEPVADQASGFEGIARASIETQRQWLDHATRFQKGWRFLRLVAASI